MTLLYLFLITLPFQFALNPFSGIDLPFGRILVPIFFIATFCHALKRCSLKISFTPLSLFLGLFLCWAILSLAWAPHFPLGARKALFLFNYFPLFWFLPLLLKKNDRPRIEAAILYPGLIVSLVGIIQFFARFIIGSAALVEFWQGLSPFLYGNNFSQAILQYPSWLVEVRGQEFFRAIGFFPDPHIFGFYLAFVTPLAFLSSHKRFHWFGMLFIPALLLTFSRQAYIGALVALLAFIVLSVKRKVQSVEPKRKTKSFKLFAVVLSFALCALSLFLTPIGSRLLSSLNPLEGSNSERLENWTQAISLIKEHSFLGVGMGNYALALDPLIQPRAPVSAHNLYLDLWAEIGIIGLFLFLAVAINGLVSAWRYYPPAFFTLIWFFTQSFFDMPLFSIHILPLLMIFFVLADTPTSVPSRQQLPTK